MVSCDLIILINRSSFPPSLRGSEADFFMADDGEHEPVVANKARLNVHSVQELLQDFDGNRKHAHAWLNHTTSVIKLASDEV